MTADASTVPTARISSGTVSCVAMATLTGTGGGGPADWALGALHAMLSRTAVTAIRRRRWGVCSTTKVVGPQFQCNERDLTACSPLPVVAARLQLTRII